MLRGHARSMCVCGGGGKKRQVPGVRTILTLRQSDDVPCVSYRMIDTWYCVPGGRPDTAKHKARCSD